MNSRDVKTRNTKMDLELEDINKFFKKAQRGVFLGSSWPWVAAKG